MLSMTRGFGLRDKKTQNSNVQKKKLTGHCQISYQLLSPWSQAVWLGRDYNAEPRTPNSEPAPDWEVSFAESRTPVF